MDNEKSKWRKSRRSQFNDDEETDKDETKEKVNNKNKRNSNTGEETNVTSKSSGSSSSSEKLKDAPGTRRQDPRNESANINQSKDGDTTKIYTMETSNKQADEQGKQVKGDKSDYTMLDSEMKAEDKHTVSSTQRMDKNINQTKSDKEQADGTTTTKTVITGKDNERSNKPVRTPDEYGSKVGNDDLDKPSTYQKETEIGKTGSELKDGTKQVGLSGDDRLRFNVNTDGVELGKSILSHNATIDNLCNMYLFNPNKITMTYGEVLTSDAHKNAESKYDDTSLNIYGSNATFLTSPIHVVNENLLPREMFSGSGAKYSRMVADALMTAVSEYSVSFYLCTYSSQRLSRGMKDIGIQRALQKRKYIEDNQSNGHPLAIHDMLNSDAVKIMDNEIDQNTFYNNEQGKSSSLVLGTFQTEELQQGSTAKIKTVEVVSSGEAFEIAVNESNFITNEKETKRKLGILKMLSSPPFQGIIDNRIDKGLSGRPMYEPINDVAIDFQQYDLISDAEQYDDSISLLTSFVTRCGYEINDSIISDMKKSNEYTASMGSIIKMPNLKSVVQMLHVDIIPYYYNLNINGLDQSIHNYEVSLPTLYDLLAFHVLFPVAAKKQINVTVPYIMGVLSNTPAGSEFTTKHSLSQGNTYIREMLDFNTFISKDNYPAILNPNIKIQQKNIMWDVREILTYTGYPVDNNQRVKFFKNNNAVIKSSFIHEKTNNSNDRLLMMMTKVNRVMEYVTSNVTGLKDAVKRQHLESIRKATEYIPKASRGLSYNLGLAVTLFANSPAVNVSNSIGSISDGYQNAHYIMSFNDDTNLLGRKLEATYEIGTALSLALAFTSLNVERNLDNRKVFNMKNEEINAFATHSLNMIKRSERKMHATMSYAVVCEILSKGISDVTKLNDDKTKRDWVTTLMKNLSDKETTLFVKEPESSFDPIRYTETIAGGGMTLGSLDEAQRKVIYDNVMKIWGLKSGVGIISNVVGMYPSIENPIKYGLSLSVHPQAMKHEINTIKIGDSTSITKLALHVAKTLDPCVINSYKTVGVAISRTRDVKINHYPRKKGFDWNKFIMTGKYTNSRGTEITHKKCLLVQNRKQVATIIEDKSEYFGIKFESFVTIDTGFNNVMGYKEGSMADMNYTLYIFTKLGDNDPYDKKEWKMFDDTKIIIYILDSMSLDSPEWIDTIECLMNDNKGVRGEPGNLVLYDPRIIAKHDPSNLIRRGNNFTTALAFKSYVKSELQWQLPGFRDAYFEQKGTVTVGNQGFSTDIHFLSDNIITDNLLSLNSSFENNEIPGFGNVYDLENKVQIWRTKPYFVTGTGDKKTFQPSDAILTTIEDFQSGNTRVAHLVPLYNKSTYIVNSF